MRILAWGSTDVGMKRDHNEDSFLIREDLGLCVVADGMGGHAGGEMASSIAVKTIEEGVTGNLEVLAQPIDDGLPVEKNPVARLISDCVRKACGAIYKKAQERRELQGMGTTTIAVLFHGKHAFVAHVGDSRAYLMRDGRILQLSEDHSLVNEQLRAGLITETQARQSRFKNIITRSVGFEEDVAVDIIAVEAREGDCYLLCSDGLANLLKDEEISEISGDNFLRRAPEMLIDLANKRGGDDNVTVVVAYVDSLEASQKAA
ncbi:MAG: Stp1/IreP family PP2C-type Ser/Thr phosphatase [Deltaproteobacteria bacterium]|nr:Stp1/IreP family PP2C-type Ser/Thr phosphatase [Deltaproteobacteria bacterium]